MTDPIADMLTRIRNGFLAHLKTVSVPHSNMKLGIAKLLEEAGYISRVSVEGDKKKTIILTLVYKAKQPSLSSIKRISKPGRRVYVDAHNLPRTLSGYGVSIISTNKGLMFGKQARKLKVGGEIICQVW